MDDQVGPDADADRKAQREQTHGGARKPVQHREWHRRIGSGRSPPGVEAPSVPVASISCENAGEV